MMLALSMLCGACGSTAEPQAAALILPTAAIIAPPQAARVVPLPPVLPTPAVATPRPLPLPATQTPAYPLAPLSAADDPAAAEAELARLINQTRAEHGLPPYELSEELSAAARAHSCDLAASALISHLASDGRTLAQRLAGSQTAWQWPSENIAAGADDPREIVAMWMDEPPDGPHLLNILSPDQQALGTGYCFRADDLSGNQHYWTADFARR